MSSQNRSITELQIDSAYNKIQRGKINAERVRILQNDVFLCDSVSNLKTSLIGVRDAQLLTKDSIIANHYIIEKELKGQVKNEIKRGRRRAFWSFLRGTVVGGLIMAILSFL